MEPPRQLALDGAQLLLAIGCNGDPFTLDFLTRVRAFENQCHVIYVNQHVGTAIGGSVAHDPTGRYHLRACVRLCVRTCVRAGVRACAGVHACMRACARARVCA